MEQGTGREDGVPQDGIVDELLDTLIAEERHATEPGEVFSVWVAKAIRAYPRPAYPLEREWNVSVQGLLRLVPRLPRIATAPLGLLDRFGAVTVGPERVGLDGKDVDWNRVVEVRTEPAWTLLSAEMLELDLSGIITLIPPVPGRRWVLRRISELMFTLYLAALPPLDDDRDATGGDGPGLTVFAPVVSTVVYRRMLGHGEARASAMSALLQVALPGTADTIVATARAHGVPVVEVPVDETDVGAVARRAQVWRRSALGMRTQVLGRLGR
ncbi:hypothetical protein [Cellulomonas sp. URHB0016]